MAKSPEQEHPTKAFGLAATDPSGVLSPFKFSRRSLHLLPCFVLQTVKRIWCLFSFHFLSYNKICICLMQEIVMFCMISIYRWRLCFIVVFYMNEDDNGVFMKKLMSCRATGEKDVRFKVLYCGICHSDLHMVKNEWGSSTYPLVPGYVPCSLSLLAIFFPTFSLLILVWVSTNVLQRSKA